jgi:hypothetical protein
MYSNIYPTRCNLTQFTLSGNCSTCFGWYDHPSSGAQTTVSTASGICHTVIAICRYRRRVGTGLSVLWVAYATALEGVEGSASRPGRSLTPGKTLYLLYRMLGAPQDRSGQVRKTSPPPGFYPRTVQPVASRYTDYATRPTRRLFQLHQLTAHCLFFTYLYHTSATCFGVSHTVFREKLRM